MKRKQFLTSLLPLASLPGSVTLFPDPGEAKSKYQIPDSLTTGDLIGITCTGGPVQMEKVLPAIRMLESWGFKVRIGDTAGKRHLNFGGTDAERREDLQRMLDDPDIKAILFARGGYGTVRIMDSLDLRSFMRKPKWLIGFSDLTYLQSIVLSKQVACLHAKMCNSFPDSWQQATAEQKHSILSIKEALTGTKMEYAAVPHASNIAGNARGPLLGGNLKIIESLSGTGSSFKTDGCILFLEDTMEYLYSIDRMFWNLKRSGRLNRLKGLIIGGFRIKPDDPGEEFGMTVEEIILEKVKDYGYPVCFGFPVGHQPANMALKCGVIHQLTVTPELVSLREI